MGAGDRKKTKKMLPKMECKEEAGRLVPVVNLNKCEAKGPCIEVCPFDVFQLQEITHAQYARLSLLGKLKTKVHGRKKAVVAHPGACHACGLCVPACPEKAITLSRNTT